MVSKQPKAEIPASVPPGWKLVPATLTEAQKGAAQDAWWEASSAELYWERIYQVMLAAAPQPPVVEQEPVLVVEKEPDYMSRGHFYEGSRPHINPMEVLKLPIGTKLYTRPQPRQPLTPEQIMAAWNEAEGTRYGFFAFARAIERAIERAHGIGGEA